MTLRDKFLPYVDCIYPIDGFENKEWAIRNAKQCEQIANDYAIEFTDWLIKRQTNYFEPLKQLLEVFKKEKGL